MPGRVPIEVQGKKEPPSANTPTDCGICQYFEQTYILPGYWDSVHDGMQFYVIVRDTYFRKGWDALWNAFVCPPPGKACKVRESCSKKPTFLAAWLKLVLDPVGLERRWVVYMTIGRKIKCVGEGPGKNDDPEIPQYDELPPDELPDTEKNEGGGSLVGSDKSEEGAVALSDPGEAGTKDGGPRSGAKTNRKWL